MRHQLLENDLQRFNVSRESLTQLETYVELLLTWQEKINLIGPSTVSDVWRRHVLDALQLLPLLKSRTGVVADLGSGAGVPGLVLALASDVHVHLYESNGKKAAFLHEAIRQTKARAEVHQIRLEALPDHVPSELPHTVTARALAPLNRLIDLASPFLLRGATGLFHKGQDVDSEVLEATKSWKIGAIKHLSITDSMGCILEVKEIARV